MIIKAPIDLELTQVSGQTSQPPWKYIDDSYILKQDEREKRLDEFISKVNGTKAMTLDFVENVENALSSGNYSKEFANEVRELVEGI